VSARRVLGRIAIVFAILFLVLAGLLWYGLSSERVARRLITSVLARAGDGITIGRMSGSIRGPLVVHDVVVRKETFGATIDSAILFWTPTGLIRRQVRVDRLHATGVHVAIPDSVPGDTAPPRPRLPMDVILGDVLVRDLSVDAPNDVTVRSGTIRLDGRAEDYRFVAEATVSMPRARDLPVTLSGTGNLDHVELDSSTAAVFDGEVHARGRVTWWPRTEWRLDVRGSGIDPAPLMKEPAEWPGAIDFTGSTAGYLDSIGPVGTLRVDSLRGALRGQRLGGTAHVEFAGTSANVPSLDVTWGSARLTGRGAVADSVSAEFDLAVGDLRTALPDAAGSLRSRGTVRGTREIPRIRATFEGRRLRLGNTSAASARGRADFALSPRGRTDLDLRALGAAAGPLAFDTVNIVLRGTRNDHRLTASAVSPTRSVSLAAAGGVSARTWRGRLQRFLAETGTYGSWELESPITLAGTVQSATLSEACLTSPENPGARICGSGAWLGGANWRAAGRVEALPLALLDSFVPDSVFGDSQSLEGTLAATFDAASRGGRLAGHLVAEAENAALVYQRLADTAPRRLFFDTAQVRLEAGAAGFRGEGSLHALHHDSSTMATLAATVAIPGFTRLGPSLSRQRLEGTVTGRMDSLAVATEFFPALDSLAGRATLETRLAGTVGAPAFDGRLSFDSIFAWLPRGRAGKGSVQIAAAGTLVEPGRVTGQFTVVPRGVIYDYTLDEIPRRVLVDSGGLTATAGPSGSTVLLTLGVSDTAHTRIASFTSQLTLPQYRAFGAPLGPEPLTLTLDAEIPDLAFARALTDRYDSLGGRISLRAKASGRVATPDIEAELRVDDFLARSQTGTITRGGLLGTLTALVAPDSTLSGELRLVPSGVRFAYVEAGAFEAIALDSTALVLRAGADGIAGGLDLAFTDTSGTTLGTFNGTLRLPAFRKVGRPLAPEPLEATLDAKVSDLAFAEAFSPEIDSLAGQLDLDVRMSGTVGDPAWTGGLHVRDAAMRLPLLGALYREIRLDAVGTPEGDVRVDGRAAAGSGAATLTGTTPVRSTSARPGRLEIRGENFEVMNTAELRAVVTPELDVTLIADTIDLRGKVEIPIARMQLTEIPEFAVPPSDDVVFVGESLAAQSTRPIRAEVEVLLGDSVSFTGFNFDADLDGALVILEAPFRPTRASGGIIIERGQYKAYGQDLTVSQGRVQFAGGPVDNPALSIRASRTADDGTVAGLQIGGTLKSPVVTIWSEPSMSQNSALHYIVMGRAPGEGAGADGSLLSRAASSLGLRGSNVLASSLGQGFGLDDARIESDGGFHEASFVAGTYLSPSLYVSYGIGLFDPISTLRLRYLLSRKWTLQAETGAETGADLLYKIERGR
jgi:autotransporter translocation and assembly factor TamB